MQKQADWKLQNKLEIAKLNRNQTKLTDAKQTDAEAAEASSF
jgi:hypothetical protein